MGAAEHEIELWEGAEVTGSEYRELAEQHEQFLRVAHRAPRGSEAMLKVLHSANALEPHLPMALRRYLDAIEILTVFYEDLSSHEAAGRFQS